MLKLGAFQPANTTELLKKKKQKKPPNLAQMI